MLTKIGTRVSLLAAFAFRLLGPGLLVCLADTDADTKRPLPNSLRTVVRISFHHKSKMHNSEQRFSPFVVGGTPTELIVYHISSELYQNQIKTRQFQVTSVVISRTLPHGSKTSGMIETHETNVIALVISVEKDLLGSPVNLA